MVCCIKTKTCIFVLFSTVHFLPVRLGINSWLLSKYIKDLKSLWKYIQRLKLCHRLVLLLLTQHLHIYITQNMIFLCFPWTASLSALGYNNLITLGAKQSEIWQQSFLPSFAITFGFSTSLLIYMFNDIYIIQKCSVYYLLPTWFGSGSTNVKLIERNHFSETFWCSWVAKLNWEKEFKVTICI